MLNWLRRRFGWFERRWIPDEAERGSHDVLVRERLRDEPPRTPAGGAPSDLPDDVDPADATDDGARRSA